MNYQWPGGGCVTRSKLVVLVWVLLSVLLTAPVSAQEAAENEVEEPGDVTVVIVEPFIEIHTGPAASYPITQVIDRGNRLFVIRQYTDWFRVQSESGVTGWVSRESLEKTTLTDGTPLRLRDLGPEDFSQRDWTFGFAAGQFQSVPVYSVFGSLSLHPNLAAEVSWSNSVGNVSSSTFIKGNVVMFPFGDLAYSPFISLGVGEISISPSSNLVALDDKESRFGQLGVAVQTYVSRRFTVRLELNEYILFSATADNDDNEEVDEWKVGFAVFF